MKVDSLTAKDLRSFAPASSTGRAVARALALKVGARHIVQQQVVLQVEQRAKTFFQMLFDGRLVQQQPIQPA